MTGIQWMVCWWVLVRGLALHYIIVFMDSCNGHVNFAEWSMKRAQLHVPDTLHYIMAFMGLHNGHVDF
jgi:hypothetical protein